MSDSSCSLGWEYDTSKTWVLRLNKFNIRVLSQTHWVLTKIIEFGIKFSIVCDGGQWWFTAIRVNEPCH